MLWELLAQAELREAANGAAAAAGSVQQQQQASGGAGEMDAGVLAVTAKYGKLRGVLANRAAFAGRVEVLEVLQAAGWVPTLKLAEAAASRGHGEAVAWAVERMGDQNKHDPGLVGAAAVSGNTALVRQLRTAGWACGREAVGFAALTGNGELLEWLVEQGCPVGVSAGGRPTKGVLRQGPAMPTMCADSSEGASPWPWLHAGTPPNSFAAPRTSCCTHVLRPTTSRNVQP